jgi:hypothetical protein
MPAFSEIYMMAQCSLNACANQNHALAIACKGMHFSPANQNVPVLM